MILAAGLGTRLKPLTDTMPKALVAVGGKPLLEWNIRKLQAQGYDRFVVNIHHFAQQIVDYVAQQDYAPLVQFSDETEALLETGGGLKKAQHLFRDDEPILLHNVDILDNVMGWINRETGEIKSPFPWLREAELTIDDNLNVTSYLSPLTSHLYAFAFSGIHSFSPRLFPLMDHFPDRFGIIDFYLSVCHRAHIVGLVKPDLDVLDVGKLDSLEKAEEFTI